MSNTLDIKEINSLVDIGSSLRKFKQEIIKIISEIQSQINKELEWVQDKVVTSQREVERYKKAVENAKLALNRCQQSGTRDRDGRYQPPNCSSEEVTLAKVESCLREWSQKLQIAQKWRSKIEQHSAEFGKAERRLSRLATDDTGKALQELGRLIAGYQAVESSALQISDRFYGNIPHTTGFDFENIDSTLLKAEGTHGALYERAKKEFFLRSLDNPDVKDFIKGWIRQEIRRSGLHGTWRNPPGFDVGHKVVGIDCPENFHWENSDMNRSRGAKQHR